MFEAAKLVLVFVVLIVFLMRRANMGALMAGCAILLGVLFQLDGPGFLRALERTCSSVTNIELIVALGLIMLLEHVMGHTGVLQRMVTSLRALVGDTRVVMAALPALVGLIPSAGGAIFSAPMVDEVSRDSGLSPERKTFVNYWYRHLWEYVLPLYPALLLAAQVYGVSTASMITLLLPAPLLVVLFGWPVAFSGVSRGEGRMARGDDRRQMLELAAGLGPVITIVFLVLVFRLSVPLAVGSVLAILLVANRWGPSATLRAARQSISINVLFSVFAVLFFKEVLVSSGAVSALTPLFLTSGIPVGFAFAVLPFLVGILTGSPQAVVGTTGPILLGLAGTASATPALAASALASGMGGCIVSPAHLCFVLTNGYFHADFARSLRLTILPQIAVTTVMLVYLALL